MGARTHPQLVGFLKKESNGYIVDVFADDQGHKQEKVIRLITILA